MRNSIFISHRTVDSEIADMILDFLVACDIPRDLIFCSSLPGNDVEEQISPEVKQRLKKAAIIILILSKSYYESAYCINEAGVAWYLDDVKAIPFGLPEINHSDMVGFLNSDYKLRRLDNEGDISYLYDQAQERLNTTVVKHSVITQETKKLLNKYQKYIEGREISSINNKVGEDDDYDFGDIDNTPLIVGQDHVGHIPVDSAFLLVYAAYDNGQIIKTHILGLPVQVSAARKQFMKDLSQRESARWEEALDRLISWGWVKPMGRKGEIFELTGTGYQKADWLKEGMQINTDNEPLDELKGFE